MATRKPNESLLNRVLHIIRDFDHEYSEFMLALFKTLIGFWYLMPWSSFSASPTGKSFSEFAPEWVWGLCFFVFGVVQLYCVMQGARYKLRATLSMAGMWLWIIFTVLTVLSNWRGVGWIITFIFILTNIVIYLRLKNVSAYAASRGLSVT